MTEQYDERPAIALAGDWTIAAITERLAELTPHLHSLVSAAVPANPAPRICVQGVESIDASGCQLLAVFLRQVRRHGFAPVLVDGSIPFRASVEQLGFGEELEQSGGTACP